MIDNTYKKVASDDLPVTELKISTEIIIRNAKHFKIGKTSNPDTRDQQYFTNKESGTMYLILETHDKNVIERTEAFLISFYGDRDGCDNKIGGSAGVMDDDPPFYVYIVVSEHTIEV